MGNLNKAEMKALKKTQPNLEKELRPLKKGETFYYDEDTGKFSIRKIEKKKDIDRTEDYMDFKSGKKDEGYKVMEAAKGGEVKGYHKGGPVHKKKNTMATTKGWGISRKT